MSLNYFSSQDCSLLQMRQNSLFQSHELTHGRIISKQKITERKKNLEFYLMTLLRLLDAGAGVWFEGIKIVPGSWIQNQDNYHHAEAVK